MTALGYMSLTVLLSAANPQNNLMLRADESGPAFIDSSGAGHPTTAINVGRSTTEYAFGGQSMVFDGSGSLNILDHPHWNLAGDDFTIDFWIKRSGSLTSGVQTALSQWHSSLGASFIFLHHASYHGTNELGFWLNGQVIPQLKGILGTGWTHVAAVRNGDVIRLYFDGVQVGSDYQVTSGWQVLASSAELKVGNQQNGTEGVGWVGFIDEVRFTKQARDSADFPPTRAESCPARTVYSAPHPLTTSPNDKLYCTTHNASSVLQSVQV